jgi:hypothetical protein
MKTTKKLFYDSPFEIIFREGRRREENGNVSDLQSKSFGKKRRLNAMS